jgi:hypothetical protein
MRLRRLLVIGAAGASSALPASAAGMFLQPHDDCSASVLPRIPQLPHR